MDHQDLCKTSKGRSAEISQRLQAKEASQPQNCHVVNMTTRTLWVKVSKDEVHLKACGPDWLFLRPEQNQMYPGAKVPLEKQFNEEGFTKIGSNEFLKFGFGEKVYVTAVYTGTGEENVDVLCYNDVPPPGKSVTVTDNDTFELSDSCEILSDGASRT